MIRCICSLHFLPVACIVLAAPAPKDSWERPIDPDKDCKIDIKHGIVTIEVPGGDHELDPKRRRFNAPCLLREVVGDFAVQVRVSASFRPSAKSCVKGQDPRVAAGLVLIPSEKNYIRHEYGAYRRKGKQENSFASIIQGEKLRMNLKLDWKPSDWVPNEEHIYLRFERQANCIRIVISPDGKTWDRHQSWETMNLPNSFKVGLAAYSTSSEPFKVRFDQFKLTHGGEKKK